MMEVESSLSLAEVEPFEIGDLPDPQQEFTVKLFGGAECLKPEA